MMEEQVWQMENVYQPSYNFKIKLDADFAQNVQEISIPQDYQKNLNSFSEDILEDHNFRYPSPLRFYQDTFLATGFHIGNNGTWLSTEDLNDLEQNESIEYYTHNIDNSSEAYALIALFDNWADKAAVLLEE